MTPLQFNLDQYQICILSSYIVQLPFVERNTPITFEGDTIILPTALHHHWQPLHALIKPKISVP